MTGFAKTSRALALELYAFCAAEHCRDWLSGKDLAKALLGDGWPTACFSSPLLLHSANQKWLGAPIVGAPGERGQRWTSNNG